MKPSPTTTVPADAIGKLREALAGLKNTALYKEIVEPKDIVLARFQPVFAPEHVTDITEDEFRSFLLFENNHHWTGLHRQGSRICTDIIRLREALSILVDEARPIAGRLDSAIKMVKGMGKNIATAILLITQPDRYGVWNNRSEAVMKQLGLWPQFQRGESLGNQYVKVNHWWYLEVTRVVNPYTHAYNSQVPGPCCKGQRLAAIIPVKAKTGVAFKYLQ